MKIVTEKETIMNKNEGQNILNVKLNKCIIPSPANTLNVNQ